MGRTVIATVRTGIPDRSEPLVGGNRSATSGGWCRKRRKRGFYDGAKPFKSFDFAIESAVRDRNKASNPPPNRAGTVPGFSLCVLTVIPLRSQSALGSRRDPILLPVISAAPPPVDDVARGAKGAFTT